jgi:hypothetical protein
VLRKKNKKKKRKPQTDLRRSSGESDGQQVLANGQTDDNSGQEQAAKNELTKISNPQVNCLVN